MKNPFAPTISREERKFQQDLQRWRQMATITGETDQAILRSQPPEVLKLIGPKVEAAFSAKTRNSGQLFPIEERDHTGRDTVRYYGDIRAAFEPFTLPSLPVQLAKLSHFEGKAYIKGQEPPAVQRAMLLRANGFAE